jgi:hypothetical protein
VVTPGDRSVLWGTSVAAPHVAGIVALLFQADPGLTQRELLEILATTARTSGGASGRAWSPRWGFGEVDAAAALQLLREGYGERVSASMSTIGMSRDVIPPDGCADVVVVPKDDVGTPVGPGLVVSIESSSGVLTSIADNEDGTYTSRYCTGSTPLGSSVTLSATADGVTIDRTIELFIAEDRAHVGAWATARGGCGTAAVSFRSAPNWLQVFLGLWT